MRISLYLKELKWYLLYNFYLILLLLIINFIYFDEILYILLKPLLKSNKLNDPKTQITNYLIFTNLVDILLIYIKIYFSLFVYIYVPIIIYQVNYFFFNSLYFYEKQFLIYINSIFIFLFGLNNLLIYFIFIPNIWSFFLNFEILSNQELFNLYFEGKINDYLNLILKFLITINFCMCIPFFIIFLNYIEIISLTSLIKNRKYIYLILLFISSIFAPPELFIQISLIIILYCFIESAFFILFIFKNYQNHFLKNS